MKTVQKIETETETASWVLSVEEDDETGDSLKTISDMQSSEVEKVATRFGVSSDFLLEVNAQFEALRDSMVADLRDIWKQVSK